MSTLAILAEQPLLEFFDEIWASLRFVDAAQGRLRRDYCKSDPPGAPTKRATVTKIKDKG
jgi:hypothetical protein